MILYGVTVVTSAFLLFLVQPIVAKQILPWFGGSAAVWTTCVLFFQTVLLAGYAYAHGLTRCAPRMQRAVHVALLAISVATLPIVASDAWKPTPESDPTLRILGLLVATIGLPYFLLSSTGPLVQRWLADDRRFASHGPRVYRLFALSNFGSLVGLVAYPFAVEPWLAVRHQSFAWSAGYGLFVVACATCAWIVGRRAPSLVEAHTVGMAIDAATDARSDAAAPPPTLARRAYWLVASALGSMLLLALTNHITQNVASIPFLWIVPLALYLLSFVVVFEGRGGSGWYVRRWWLTPAMALVVAMAWGLATAQGVLHIYAAIPLFSIGLFVACVFCHGELAATKPAPVHLTQFYLALAAGGALGGLFVALVAPRVFTNYWESPIAIVGVAMLALFTTRDRSAKRRLAGAALGLAASIAIVLASATPPFDTVRAALPAQASTWTTAALLLMAALALGIATWRRWPTAIVVAAVACSGFYAWRYVRFLSDDTLHASRNFYGTLRVKQSAAGAWQERRLMHGVILHGDQYTASDKRRMATSYYGPGSGVVLALKQLGADRPIDVAMVGLGAGTLTAWGRPGDRYRIYELDPDVTRVAQHWFTYLADSAAETRIVLGDARLSMERELDGSGGTGTPILYDVIAVDAFSSDSIPVHLITREALSVYRRHLKPDGVVAFHVSNRYLQLAPVVAQLADDAGVFAVNVVDEPADDNTYSSSEWVLVTANEAFLDRDAVMDASVDVDPMPGLPIWTDQFNNLFKILK